MARARRFLDIDVLQAAKERLRHIWDLYDTVVVCFSGGKDSLVVLHLAREVAEERGTIPLAVLFRDEELIPSVVLDFVNDYRMEPWLEMKWFCVRARGSQFILGRVRDYIQWDPSRPHMHPMPAYAITQAPGDARTFSPNDTDAFTLAHYRGKVAYLTGVRASESLIRYRASVNKLNESYINASASKRMSLCKPIYDWQENDVLRFVYERKIPLCDIYGWQHISGERLRVSTPLHQESAKRIDRVAARDPAFYNDLLKLFPETEVQRRYWTSIDNEALMVRYGENLDGVRAYIETIEDPKRHDEALSAFERALGRITGDPEAYPPRRVLTWIKNGSYGQEIMVSSELSKKRRERRERGA